MPSLLSVRSFFPSTEGIQQQKQDGELKSFLDFISWCRQLQVTGPLYYFLRKRVVVRHYISQKHSPLIFSSFFLPLLHATTQAPKKTKAAAAAAAPKAVKAKADPLFPPRPRTTQIGGDIRPQGRDLSRFVKWPKYVRIQRQRAVLYQRLKVPPAINQFTKTLGKNEAMTVFTLFNKYRPETPAAKKQRIKSKAAEAASGKETTTAGAPHQIKFGLKHITSLIEEKKAQLVLIACDVDPIEIVMWMPALCRKMNVPFMIVKDKARLGALVHQKTASCLALTGVGKQDQAQLDLLKNLAMEKYNNNSELVRKWGGGIMGLKTQAKLDKRAKALAIEEAKKLASLGKA